MRVAPLLCLSVLVLAHAGCAKDYVTNSEGDVIFRIVDINGGELLESDVFFDDGQVRTILPDIVDVTVANRPKNPRVDVPQVAMAVFVERYEVSYTRSDGRNTAGVDVPYPFTGRLTTVVDVATSGQTVTIPLTVVRHQQKDEPPLRNMRTGGGQFIFTVTAQITLHGRTTAGQAVSDTGYLPISFADFGN
ncbi:MAG TPA: hypothetical protein VFM88_01985 [Vicinamibacteria bacterium]|nr:hypothetical protein [Vicinamibacteria bacterium]